MTYHLTKTRSPMRARARRARRPALGGLIDFIEGGGGGGISWLVDKFRSNDNSATQVDCINQANAKTASMDARWFALDQNWHPTGFYTPDDVNTILQTGIVALSQAKVIVVLSPYSTSDATEVIGQAVTDIDKQLVDAQRFVNAIGAAKQQGVAVAAPDLKNWLTKSLMVASNGFVVRSVLECNTTWIDQADYYVTQAYNVAVKVGGIAVDAVEAVVNVAAGAFDAVSFVSSYAKYWFIPAAAFVVWWKFLKKKS